MPGLNQWTCRHQVDVVTTDHRLSPNTTFCQVKINAYTLSVACHPGRMRASDDFQ